MTVTHDPIDRAAYIAITDDAVEESEELASGLIVDYSATGAIVGVEVLDAPAATVDLGATPPARSVFWYLRTLLAARVADPREQDRVAATLEHALGELPA